MAALRSPILYEVIFVTPHGPTMLAMTEPTVSNMCRTARDLKASHFVARDGWDNRANCPIWIVVEMRKCDPNGGGPGVWSMGTPTRSFSHETNDAAVMWALHHSAWRK